MTGIWPKKKNNYIRQSTIGINQLIIVTRRAFNTTEVMLSTKASQSKYLTKRNTMTMTMMIMKTRAGRPDNTDGWKKNRRLKMTMMTAMKTTIINNLHVAQQITYTQFSVGDVSSCVITFTIKYHRFSLPYLQIKPWFLWYF